MIKPRYFSVNHISGEIRGILFCVAIAAAIGAPTAPSAAQTTLPLSADVLHLVFDADTVVVNRYVLEPDVQESLYQEAWRHGYFRSTLTIHEFRMDTLYAHFEGSGRFKWTTEPIQWKYVSSDPETSVKCDLSGKWYTENALQDCIKLQTDALFRQGYLDPSVSLDSLFIDDTLLSVSAVISILKGESALLSDVKWTGLSKTGPEWLNKAVGAQKGMILNEANILRVSDKLNQTRLFDDISDPEIIRHDEKWALMYTITERPLTFFDLIVGYVPDQTGKAVIAGNGSLHIRNAGFDGTELKVEFDRQSPRVGKMSIELDQHLIFGHPLGLNGAFSLARQDSLWQNRMAKAGIWWNIHENVRVFTAVQREVSTSATSSQASANLWGTYGQIGLTYDSRNDYGMTTAGVLAEMAVESGRQIVEPSLGDRYNQVRRKISGNLSVYLPISTRNILIPGLWAGTIFTDRNPFLNDLYRIGGATSIRGYREDQFFATSYLWGDIEYRYLLDTNSYLFAFGSAGWLWLPPNEASSDTATDMTEVSSFGVGLALKTNLGLLKLTYAKSPEDPFANAKVHVGISSGF